MARPKLSSDKTKMTISFTEYDEDVYDFLKNTKNASRLIKELVRAHMCSGGQVAVVPRAIPVYTKPEEPETKVVEEVVATKSGGVGYAKMSHSNDIGDVSALANLEL